MPIPDLKIDGARRKRLAEAYIACGRLEGIFAAFPAEIAAAHAELFLYAYVRREAVLSSQIEGTQSSLSDLLLFEAEEMPAVSLNDVVEVSNYVAALDHGLRRLREGFPLSNRLIREIHCVLLSRGRGADKLPGEFRRTQNWIGGTRPGNAAFVPPPPQELANCMGALESFLNDKNGPETLIKAALAHVQFERIHPFLDGNGRVGRLLIALLLQHQGLLRQPLLYLSLYFKQHRSTYYRLLDVVRTEGDWEAWIDFFLEGVEQTATAAVDTSQRLFRLFLSEEKQIETLGRRAAGTLTMYRTLQRHPITTISKLAKAANVSFPTAARAIDNLLKLGILKEITGRARDRIYVYSGYISILNEGTEPL